MPTRAKADDSAAQLNIPLDKFLLDELKKMAKYRGISVSAFVRELIEGALNVGPLATGRDEVVEAIKKKRPDLWHELLAPATGRTAWRVSSGDLFGNTISRMLLDDDVLYKERAGAWVNDYLKRVSEFLPQS